METIMIPRTKVLCLYPKCIRIKVKILQITKKEIENLDLQEFKRLVKKRFKEIIRRCHPDTRDRKFSFLMRNPQAASANFNRIISAYHFLMGLTENDLRIMRQNDKPIPDWSMPWHYEKEIKLGWGFHQIKYADK